jgi:cellulose synthase/poly-beta-1,6-N-acetylglucosamine synthase-like glycosyltransferase
VIIPAHNEELSITSCVESLRASANEDTTRIIAIAHNCSDQTAARAVAAGAEVVTFDEPLARGKGSALSVGFAYASSQGMDAALVIDADSTVSKNLIGAVREALASGAEAVQCRYEMDGCAERPVSKLTALAFRGFNVIRPSGRERLGLSTGILGNGFAVRQKVLEENPYDAHSVVEDLEFHIRLVLSGRKVRYLKKARVSSAMPSSKQGEASQRSRWEGGRVNMARTWFLPLMKQLTRGQVRLLDPLLDLASPPIGYAVFLLLLIACFPLIWVRVYVLLAMIVIGSHVIAAAWSGSDFAGDLLIVLRAPGYILWKLCMLPNLVRNSHSKAAWVRTERKPPMPVTTLDIAAENGHGAAVHSLEVS